MEHEHECLTLRVPPSKPTFSGSTTPGSPPSDVKCGEFTNSSDFDDGEGGCAVEDDDEGENITEAKVPFVAEIAARVRSASGTNFLLPARRTRQETVLEPKRSPSVTVRQMN